MLIQGKPAATLGSGTTNVPPHIPPGGPFQIPPTNRGTVPAGSATVLINGKPAARTGDKELTCADPIPLPNGTIAAVSTVQIGG
ncbi:PAAR domain-containing protein [Actinoplanes sp. NPDC051494]|uniref:PAAR domain-containing protein n=1 Tax=Actinoplanes sp. NPDC051494 TaxID=3363907 RepID=UPI0037A8851D